MKDRIVVLWTEPIRLEDVSRSRYAGQCGLYMVFTNDGCEPELERLIYLGKTNGTFEQRIYQHIQGTGDSGRFLRAKGQKFISFGLIPRPFKCPDKVYSRMIAHAESVDIATYRPVFNKKNGWTIPEYRDIPVENYLISDILNTNLL